MDKEEARQNRRALKSLLDSAGYHTRRAGEYSYEIAFGGKYRHWEIQTHLHNGWLGFRVYFMDLPQPGALRSKLFERVAELNDDLTVLKFVKSGDILALDMQYRKEHIDAEVLRNVVGMVYAACEEHYPQLFRIVAGDETLSSLESAFQRRAITGGSQ